MLKRLLPSWLLILVAVMASAQNQTVIELVSQSGTTAVVKVTPSSPVFKPVQTPDGVQYQVQLNEGTPVMKKGFPDLDKLTTSLVCLDGMVWSISGVQAGAYAEYTKAVAPSKGNVYRNVDIATVPFEKAPFYNENEFFPYEFAFLRDAYVLRDYAAQALIVQPLQYNPATQTVRVYNELLITLKAVPDASGITAQVRNHMPVPREYANVYDKQFLNYSKAKQARYTPLGEEGEMLVICHDAFMPEMQPFVQWKNQKGIRTVMVPTSAVGNTRQLIKAYIQNYYNNNNLAYVLLVGDAAQIPASVMNHGWAGNVDSDIEYGYLAGSDSYPEIFVGRFSGTTAQHIQVQVEKTITYEKYPSTGAAAQWYTRGVGVASNEGPGDNNQYDYQHMREIRDWLLAYNYTDVPELYQGSQGGLDANGDPTAAMLAAEINAGASVFNYTGHGDVSMILTSNFYNTNVNNLTNVGKWPFLWIVGCQVGNFVSNTCFGEAWARATSPNGHTGAVASMMAAINQSWNPPMSAQDEMNKILTGAFANNIKRTFGGVSFNGCMKMNDAYGNAGNQMTDTWILFGDPSLNVRTNVPVNMNVTHAGQVPMGVSSLQINCDVNGALASLTLNGELISTATVAGGIATFTFDPINVPDTLLVTVTGYNTVPYWGDVLVIPNNGPYVVNQALTVADVSGNNNGNADYNETVNLTIPLNNLGNAAANGVTATLTTNDPHVTVLNGSVTYGNLGAGTSGSGTGAFQVKVNPIIPDLHPALFQLNITDNGGNTWTNNVTLTLHAPMLTVMSYTINDAAGNNNGRLDPGESAVINLVVTNAGTADATVGAGTFASGGWQVSVPMGTQNGAVIASGGNITQSFNVTVDPNATLYSFVTLNYGYDASGYPAAKTISTKIGLASEDFETNDFTKFNWQLQGNANWHTTNVNPFEGTYCSRSGAIGNSQSSTLSIQVSSAVADTIRFARRVSSEANYDFLRFYIGAALVDSWSGVIPWGIVKYPVAAGNNTFKWTYIKDNYLAANADAAWVDAIDLPLNALATAIFETETASAGNDASVYPNPAHAATTLWYAIGQNADVAIDVHNTLGQHIARLQPLVKQPAGSYTIGVNTNGWPAGMYVITFRVNGDSFTRKLNVVR